MGDQQSAKHMAINIPAFISILADIFLGGNYY